MPNTTPFAPTAMARVDTAARVIPGLRRSDRNARRRSCPIGASSISRGRGQANMDGAEGLMTEVARRPEPDEHVPYYSRYVKLVPDGPIVETLATQIEDLLAVLTSLSP